MKSKSKIISLFSVAALFFFSGCPGDKIVSITEIWMSQSAAAMTLGDKLYLSAVIYPESATHKTVRWESNKPAIASVSDIGMVSAQAAGTAVISVIAQDGGKSATCDITVTEPPKPQEPSKNVVVAYHNGTEIDVNLVTHIMFSFAQVNMTTYDRINVNENILRTLANYKNIKPSLKISVAIGGWGAGGFSEMAGDEQKRLAFAQDCKRLIVATNIDGIDLDWEYPGSSVAGIVSSTQDKENFTLLCRDIRDAIGDDKLLTFASPANANFVDFQAVMPYIDFVDVMTYDMGNPPNYHHSALYKSTKTNYSCDQAVTAHFNAGVPYEKMVLGIPFYGRTDPSLSSGDNAAIYRDIIGNNWLGNPNRRKLWDDISKVPYIVDETGKMICTYDDPESIAIKCKWILEKGIYGAMYWHYSHDDNSSTLRRAVFNGINR